MHLVRYTFGLFLLVTLSPARGGGYEFQAVGRILNDFTPSEPTLVVAETQKPSPPVKIELPSLESLVPRELRVSMRDQRRGGVVFMTGSPYGPNRVVTLAKRDSPVRMQFGSTCTTFGLIAAMENLAGGKVDLSERFLWSLYGRYEMTRALAAAKSMRIVPEAAWPQAQVARPRVLPPGTLRVTDAPYLGNSIQSIIASIDQGYPVYFASDVVRDWRDCKPIVNPLSPKVPGAGHATVGVGYEVNSAVPYGGYLLIKNSWGTRCGLGGYQRIPFSLCARKDTSCYAWMIKAVSYN